MELSRFPTSLCIHRVMTMADNSGFLSEAVGEFEAIKPVLRTSPITSCTNVEIDINKFKTIQELLVKH